MELRAKCVEVVGQGHRSNFKVTGGENVPFPAESKSKIEKTSSSNVVEKQT